MLLLEIKINKLCLGPLNFTESRYTCVFFYLAFYTSSRRQESMFHFINLF